MVVFGISGFIRAKLVVFGQKWLYSAKSGCVRAKEVVFGESGSIRPKVIVFEPKWL